MGIRLPKMKVDIKTLPPELKYRLLAGKQRESALQDWGITFLTVAMAVTITVEPVNRWLDKLAPAEIRLPKTSLVSSNGIDTQKINDAALSMYMMDTSMGPDGGRNACAWWVVLHVIRKATGGYLGNDPTNVPDVRQDLRNGYGTQISKKDARPGDIIILLTPTSGHIGVVVSWKGQIRGLSTGSHVRYGGPGAAWVSDLDFNNFYGAPTEIYRLNKVRRAK
jgi:hypothetical protein